MKLIIAALLFTSIVSAQQDSSKLIRAFPITDYMVALNDSVKIVQIELPDGVKLMERQLGILRGTYQQSTNDTVSKGYGRCQLIKGNFYYFPIGNNKSGVQPVKGDLIYIFVDRPKTFTGRISQLATHFILLKNTDRKPLYDRYSIFQSWDQQQENKLIDSLVADIQFTGNYFRRNDNSMDVTIASGPFSGKKLLQTMIECQRTWVEDFLDYMNARPRLYAGREWVISEIFATWLNSGAPKVIAR